MRGAFQVAECDLVGKSVLSRLFGLVDNSTGEANKAATGNAGFEALPHCKAVDVFVLVEIHVQLHIRNEDLSPACLMRRYSA